MSTSRTESERELNASTEVVPSGQVAVPELRVPALTVLAHPDARRVGERVLLPALGSGRRVPLSRLAPRFVQPGEAGDRPLGDLHLSRTPLHLAPGEEPGAVRVGDDSKRGRWELQGVRAPGVVAPDELERGAVLLLAGKVALLLHRRPAALPREPERCGLLGESSALERLLREIRRAAGIEAPVLLRGESGTGKELAASALHRASPRRHRPYLALNLGALPPALAASELFGVARGAYTGAERKRAGFFERADSGTLFLDEVGEAPPETQVQLLRALESGEIQPVGAEAGLRVDVRIVAATDADLEAACARGTFRAPLFHRLRGLEIRLPSLRERRDDVGRLLHHFLGVELAALGRDEAEADPEPAGAPALPAPLVARLALHDWPGNVRELRTVARRLALAFADRDDPRASGGASLAARLAAEVESALARPATATSGQAGRGAPAPEPAALPPGPQTPRRPAYRPVAEVEEDELRAALRASRWNLAETAQRLRVSRTSLYARLERHGTLRKAADLDEAEIAAALERHGDDLEAAAGELGVSPHGLKIRRTGLAGG